MPDEPGILASRVLADRRVELLVQERLTQGLIRVRRRSGDVKLTERDVTLVLRKAGVKLTEDVLRRVSEGVARVNADAATDATLVAAQGVPPERGRDAQLLWTVEPHAVPHHHTDENGSADFRNLRDNGNVQENQLLLTIIPGRRGTPGIDIFGEPIRPRAAAQADVRCGRNVRVSDDGTQFFARTNGRLSFRHNVVSVENVYEIHGSIDYSVGNVDFGGPVVIHGDVCAGFEVRSGDSIEVYGSVEAACLSAGADVRIHGGINGRGKARVECGGSFRARYLNGAKIEAKGNVDVVRSVVHSHVCCGGDFRVAVQGVRASTIVAGGDVDVPILGSERGLEVQVSAGVDVDWEKGLDKIDEAARTLTRERQGLKQDLGGLVREPARIVEMYPVEKRARLAQMLRRYFEIERELEQLQDRRNDLTSRARQAADSRIKVGRMVHKGVTLRIANVEHTTRSHRRGPVEYAASKDTIVVI